MSGGSFRTTFGKVPSRCQINYRKHYPRGTRYRFENKYDPKYGSVSDQLAEVDYVDLIMWKISDGKAEVQTMANVSVDGAIMQVYTPYMNRAGGRDLRVITIPDDLPVDVFTPGD